MRRSGVRRPCQAPITLATRAAAEPVSSAATPAAAQTFFSTAVRRPGRSVALMTATSCFRVSISSSCRSMRVPCRACSVRALSSFTSMRARMTATGSPCFTLVSSGLMVQTSQSGWVWASAAGMGGPLTPDWVLGTGAQLRRVTYHRPPSLHGWVPALRVCPHAGGGYRSGWSDRRDRAGGALVLERPGLDVEEAAACRGGGGGDGPVRDADPACAATEADVADADGGGGGVD